jgi:pseudaminic acid biosynthesis-associated methylase
MKTEQQEFWLSDFGKSYLERNKTRDSFNKLFKDQSGFEVEKPFFDFFSELDRNMKILEFGCNVGLKLEILKEMGFNNLTGIDINSEAISIAKSNNPEIEFSNNTLNDFIEKGEKFDLVFTSLVLIHQHPNNIGNVISDIIEVSDSYIFGYEYFNEDLKEIEYRGNKNVLWKQDFPRLFIKSNPSMKIIKEIKYQYENDNNIDVGYLIKK